MVRSYMADLWVVKIVLLGLLYGFMHHFCAGIRYLFLDMHKGIRSARAARMSAAIVYFVSIPMTLVAAWLLLF